MARKPGIYFCIDRRSIDGAIQLSIDEIDETDGGIGYRICGPKYDGSGRNLVTHRLTDRDVKEIARYLRKVGDSVDALDAAAKAEKEKRT